MNGVMVTTATTSQSRNDDSVDAVISIFLPLVVHGLIRNVDRLYNLCISLARGIDAAIANNEVPSRASELPLLVKQVCKSINPMLQAAIMVLMFSVKYACKYRWFSDADAHELLILAAKLEKSFPISRNPNTDARVRRFRPTISTIMSRFLPRMKMGDILGFVVVKPGYNTYAIDFIVSNYENSSCEDKIYLFVAKTDDVETSECLKSPPNVNFLLNGCGVEERNNVSVDVGPQIPTDVTDMLTFGPNLLQLVGQFNGNYIIAFAYISNSSSIRPTLKDYVPPRIAALNSASETIEVTSRISLNCPLSLTRIKTPVKGRQCRHVQCFDFDSFMDINSIRPSWRCPYCNQYVCFTDICIDQTMVKILNEIGSSFTRVKISVDGSYKAVTETNDHTHKRRRKDPPMLPRTNLNTSINVGPSSASQISLPSQLSPLWVSQMPSSSLQHHVGPRPRTGLYTPVHGGASSASRVLHDLLWDSVQMPSSSRQHVGLQPRTDLDTVILGGPSSAYISSALPLVPLQVPQMLSSLQQRVGSQNLGCNDNSFTSQRLGNLQPPAQLPIAPRVSSAHNIRRPPITFQSPIQVHLSSHSLPSVLENADASRALSRFRRSNNTLEPSQAEQNWRPTGCMRGSLTGRAYFEALAQFLNPGPSNPADRSLLDAVEHPPGFSPRMRSLLANDRNWRAPQGGTDPRTEPGSMAGSSGSKPDPSFR